MKILLLGGSNTGFWGGWAHHFVALAERDLGANITNGFLGAVGSLYGLMQLLKYEREGAAHPEILIFEYMLNDILLVSQNAISTMLIRDTLGEISEYCLDRKIILQFLCLTPRRHRILTTPSASRSVANAYNKLAQRYGFPRPLLQDEVLDRRVSNDDYLDEAHFKPDISRKIAEALLARISALPKEAPKRIAPIRRRAFAYVDASQAETSGRAYQTKLEMTVLKGPLVEMNRPATTIWPATGQLVGVVFRSRPTSGWYRLTVGHTQRRKNACVTDLLILAELIAMQYPNIRAQACGSIEIAMPEDEAELMRLAHDISPMELSPTHPFGEQDLAIHGLMLWRGPFGFARLIESFDFWRRLVLRWVLTGTLGITV